MSFNPENNGIQTIINDIDRILAEPSAATGSCRITSDQLDRLSAAVNALRQRAAVPESFKSASETRQERLQNILDTLQESYFEVDLEGNIHFFNDTLARDLHYTPEEILNLNFRKLVDHANEKIIFEAFHRVYLTGEPIKGFDWEINKKTGEKLDVESSVALIRDEQGRPCGFRGIVRDISLRRQTEKRMRLIIENIRDVIWTRDFGLNYTYVSPSIHRMTGFTAEEAMQISPKSFLRPEQYERIREMLDEHLHKEARQGDKGQTVVFEQEILHKNGTPLWVEINVDFNRNNSGVPFEIVGVTRDITERKKAEEAFKESERRYRMIVENMRESITTMDLSLNYTYQSPSEIHVTGYTAEELVKIPIQDMVTPASYARIEQIMTEEFAREFSGEPVDPQRSRTFEIEVYHKNGGMIWEEITVSFNRDENGRPVEIMMVGRDVTGRKKMEQTIRENEKLYRMIVENMQDTIVLMDMNMRYIYQSPSEIRITGYTPEEIMKIPIEQQATPESYVRAIEILGEELEKEASGVALDPHRSRTFEMEVYHKNGGTVWLEMTASFQRDETGKPIGILMAGKNINERKKAEAEKEKLEKQLLQAQKMETIGRLAGGVAHDFNNMLNVILGYIDLVKLKLPNYHPVIQDILEIEKAACRSRDLTAQLLAFSRRQIIRPLVLNLNELIADIEKSLIRLIGEDIVFQFHPAGDLRLIKFDPMQIEQILINLAVNARDAMPNGGELIVETANINIDEAFRQDHPDFPPGLYVLLTVRDTGHGITKDHLPHIFEPFFTTKDIGKGTGLGLATVYGIVKQNEGFINVFSAPGQGSTFSVYLPAAGDKECSLQTIPVTQPRQGAGTILIVEDDEMVLNMVADMLQALGYRVIARHHPLDAVTFCEKNEMQIDLVITDVVMPALSGKELRNRLLETRPALKVLFMSGYTADIIAHHGILEEGVQFLQKPFSLNDLAAKVSQLICPVKTDS